MFGLGALPILRRPAGQVLRKRASVASLAVVLTLTLMAATGRAQCGAVAADDPVSRAMIHIQRVADQHSAAADRVLAVSRLIEEGKAAASAGQSERGKEAFEQARALLGRPAVMEESPLVQSLMLSIASSEGESSPGLKAVDFTLSANQPIHTALSRTALARFRNYSGTLTSILEGEGLPAELLAVALVESGLNRFALSPKGARGMWQLMPATATRYGLAVAPADDRRTHPEESTRAAARYLRYLYGRFGDWKLVLAAYNAGEDRVQRVMDSRGIRNFDEMSRRGYLPLETIKYVPAVLGRWGRLSAMKQAERGSPVIELERKTRIVDGVLPDFK